MAELDCPLEALDAVGLLERMEQMEKEGTTFMDKQKQDVRRRYIAPIISAVVMTALMAFLIWLMVWSFHTDPSEIPPLPLMAVLLGIPIVVILGVLIALIQRIREIGQREEDDAKRY